MSTILPSFNIDASVIPNVKIKSINFKNFKVFKDCNFNFSDKNDCKKFICFYGPNGTGKSTLLDAIALIFSRLDGRDEQNLKSLLGRLVRHTDGIQNGIYGDDDFLITAVIQTSIEQFKEYEIQISKKGFIKDHPIEIKEFVYRLYYAARYDQELHQFQLLRDKWTIFQELFQAVTGFKIEETTGLFDESKDPVQAEILNKYVLGFLVHKPDETITHKECSAGERKIIKSFSTLLNKEYMPSVVCVDNAEMHVEAGRHIQLIESMKKCFPNSQIFASTHSYQISKNFGERNQLYDLRTLKATGLIKEEPWRLYVSDEIKDGLSKLKSFTLTDTTIDILKKKGEELIKKCLESPDSKAIIQESILFLKEVAELFVKDMITYYGKK
jgi:AAA15 family ATPase/GTPase